MKLPDDAPDRAVTDVGPGDYVKTANGWEQITDLELILGERKQLRDWKITTATGVHGMFQVYRYAKAQDFRSPAAARYDVSVQRYGALGILEITDGAQSVPRSTVEEVITLQLDTLGPGDKAVIGVTRP